jgi:hypothetical protein
MRRRHTCGGCVFPHPVGPVPADGHLDTCKNSLSSVTERYLCSSTAR